MSIRFYSNDFSFSTKGTYQMKLVTHVRSRGGGFISSTPVFCGFLYIIDSGIVFSFLR